MPNSSTTSDPAEALTYADFWRYRSRQSFWLTRQFSYRLGAFLALIASRVGFSPHTVTILSFLTGIGGSIFVAARPEMPLPIAGALLFVTLHLAYALDCADGLLARAMRRTSRSGALLDKCADLLGSMIIPGILGVAAFNSQASWADDFSYAFLIWLSITPRLALTTVTWIKEGMTPEIDRKGSEDVRRHTVFWKLKKFAGNLQDDVIYRSGLAVSWAFGCYWDFILVFQSYCGVLLVVYLITSYREVAASDRASP